MRKPWFIRNLETANFAKRREHLEETLRLTHGRLDVQRLDVLPVLLQKRDKEVDSKHDVRGKLVFSHLNVANSNAKSENLL